MTHAKKATTITFPDNVDKAAEWYTERGFFVLPVPADRKGPQIRKWQNLRLSLDDLPAYFNGKKQNLGVLTGVPWNLTDVDLDALEALWAWLEFAPETGMAFGHKSKPASHHFYRTDPAVQLIQLKDPLRVKDEDAADDDRSMLIELRSLKKNGGVGLQTLVPPSIHPPTGERYEFVRGLVGEPANIDADQLVVAVYRTAACALLGRYAPAPKGGRHDFFLALSGALAHARWKLEDARCVVRAVYRVLWQASADLGKADTEVETSFRRYDDGHEVTGLPHLKQVLHADVFKTAVEWLGLGRAGQPLADSDVPPEYRHTNGHAPEPPPFRVFDIEKWFTDHGLQVRGPLPYATGKQMWQLVCPFCGRAEASLLEMNNGARLYRCACGNLGWEEFHQRVEGYSSATASSEEWDVPIPLRPWVLPAIQAEWIPGAVGKMAVAVSKATETPLEMAAATGTGVASCAVTGKVEVEVETGYIEPVNSYWMAVMGSGNRKTAVLNEMTRPVTDYEASERRRLEPEIKRIQSQRKTIEERVAFLRKKAAKAPCDATIIDQIADEEASLPDMPHVPQLVMQDVTVEKIALGLQQNRQRMGIFSDEGGFFGILGGRYSRGVPNLDIALKAYSASFLRVDRVTRPDPICLDRPLLTIVLSPQPGVLERMRDTPAFRDFGLLGRLLYLLPLSQLGNRKLDPQQVPDDVRNAYRDLITELLQLTPPSVNDVWQPWRLKLSTGAYQLWKQFQRDVEVMMRDGERLEYLRDWGSKLPGAVARVAGVFHAASEKIPQKLEISQDTMERAVRLGTVLVEHARAAFDLMERDPKVDDAHKILDWIQRGKLKQFNARDCFHTHQSRFREMAALRPVLALLVEHDYLRALPKVVKRGRPSEPFVVNPRALKEGG
jgi:hypothetical protein